MNQKIIPFDRSFASHEKSNYWSEKNSITPNNVFLKSSKMYWFNCDKCTHQFEMRIDNIVCLNQWCKYCSNQKLCNNDNCDDCFNKSFASCKQSKLFSKMNNCLPRELFKISGKKYLFNCDKCKHVYEKSLSKFKMGRDCPYCTHQKLCSDLECDDCFNKSFSSSDKILQWSDKNTVTPRFLFKGSNTKILLNCLKCKTDFSITAAHSSNRDCPLCKNKTEQIFYKKMKIYYSDIAHQFRPSWCVNHETGRILPFDYVLESHKIILELDGLQHFEQVSNWCSPQINMKRDIYKINLANKNGYSVIRILQLDVYNNKYDWINELINNINKIICDKQIQNIFMCKNNEYYKFLQALPI